MCVIELGRLVCLSESDRLVSPDTGPGDDFAQPRTPVNTGVIWSDLKIPAPAGPIWTGVSASGAGDAAAADQHGAAAEQAAAEQDGAARDQHGAAADQHGAARDQHGAVPGQQAAASRAAGPGQPAAAFQPKVTSVNAGFVTWDMATNEVVCEPGTYALHGLPENSPATMQAFLARVPEEDLPGVLAEMRQMMSSCGTYQIDYRVIGLDGSVRTMEARGRVVPGPDGRPARMTGFVMDTTTIWASREAERRRLHEGAGRTSLTQKFTAALASAVTVDAITAAARDGLASYGANSLVIVTGREGDQTPVTSYGFSPDAARLLADPEPSPGSPVAHAIEAGPPRFSAPPRTCCAVIPIWPRRLPARRSAPGRRSRSPTPRAGSAGA